MESLDLLDSFCGDIPRKRHSQIVSEGQELASLVLQVVDKLAVLSVLARKCLFELEYGSVDLACTVFKEHVLDRIESLLSNRHHHWRHISRALRALGQATLLVSHLQNLSHLRVKFLVQSCVEGFDVLISQEATLGDEIEKGTTAFSELEAGRRCWSGILFGFLFALSAFICSTFFGFDRLILCLSNFERFIELSLEDSRNFIASHKFDYLTEGSQVRELVLRFLIPILVQELASYFRQTQGHLQVLNKRANVQLDLVYESLLRNLSNVLELAILLLLEQRRVVCVQVLSKQLA